MKPELTWKEYLSLFKERGLTAWDARWVLKVFGGSNSGENKSVGIVLPKSKNKVLNEAENED